MARPRGRRRTAAGAHRQSRTTNFTLTKLLWVRTHEPALWSRVRHVLLPKDYVRYRLSGEFAIDVADALGHADAGCRRPEWSQDIMAAVGLDPAVLPRLFESPEVCARVSDEGAARDRAPGRHPDRRGCRRPGGRRRGYGHHPPRHCERHARDIGRCLCRNRPAFPRSGRAAAYVLSRHSRSVARDGCHPGGRPLAAMAPRPDGMTAAGDRGYEEMVRRRQPSPPGAEGVLWAPYLMGERIHTWIPTCRARSSALPRAMGAGTWFAPSSKASRSACAIRSRSSQSSASRSAKSGWAEAARGRRCGVRFRRTYMATTSRPSLPEEGPLRRCASWPGLAPVLGLVDEACDAVVRTAQVTPARPDSRPRR